MLALTAALVFAAQDPGAQDIVDRARAARSRNERLVTSYTANVTQRIGVGIRALRRDRMLYGSELAARITWNRDGPSRIDVVGARERIPVATRGDQVPDDLDANVEWLVIDPSADYLRIMGDDDEGFIHPLREGADADYTFAAGDTTTITLPSGRVVRLLELQVRPRRSDFRLMNGALWFDADSYGVVRAVFAPARPFDLELDGDSGDADDVPGMLKPIRATVRYVTVEYGLYEQRWWMIRYVAIEAEAQASVVRVPVRFERTYEGYRVTGGAEPLAGARRPAGSVRPQEPDVERDSVSRRLLADSLAKRIEECITRMTDSAEAAERESGVTVRVGARRFNRTCRRELREEERWPIEVVIPDDTASLMRSPELGEPILNMGDVMNEDELRQLAREIGAIPQQPWQFRSRLPDGVWSVLRTARYNRVEALSLGIGGQLDFGRLTLDGMGRIGIADLEPNFEVGLGRPLTNAGFRFGIYRRLAVANPETRALGIGNSVSALLLQRDDGQYFRTLGAEFTAQNINSGWWRVRLYAERQDEALVETQASLPRLFNDRNRFQPNILATDAEQFGASLTLRGSKSLTRALLAGADLTVDGTGGDRNYGRASLIVRAALTPEGPLAFAIEGGGGSSFGGEAPLVQGLYFLGGPATLRGFPGGTAAGKDFWRARAEIANSFPAFRVVVFGDAGEAGSVRMYSLGAGISALDGLVRLDLARGIKPYGNWRFDAYIDGLF